MRNCILFVGILVFVLFVNRSILAFDLMYAEQPMLYTANHSLHSLVDLLNIYLHPRMLDVFSIPFFRPSGHFLIYQLLMPVLGWHNTQGLLVVNLIFLALTGFLLIKTYALLFPGFRMGGYLAFSLYLMHPALFLSRLIVLHFEFAYIFFCLLSFYCFARFCRGAALRANQRYLLLALLFFLIAVTFKEPALMLGPVLALYFCFAGPGVRSRQGWQVLLLLTVTTLGLALYVSLAWPTLGHPLGGAITAPAKWSATVELLKALVGFPSEAQARLALQNAHLLWRDVYFPTLTRVILASFVFISLLAGWRSPQRQQMLFLVLAALLFLILPVNWAMGLPWHLSPSLLFLSLLAGFSMEALTSKWFDKQNTAGRFGVLLAFFIGLTTHTVNQSNLARVEAHSSFALQLARNAVLHPPPLREKLTATTLLVVEDSLLHDSYALGNGAYPLFLKPGLDFDGLQRAQAFSFLKYQLFYNGYLFRWAYLQPDLQEELYPFAVSHLNTVPDAVLHHWLQRYDDLLCVGYNATGQWQDRTAALKYHLLQEKTRRLLLVHAYAPHAAQLLNGTLLYTKRLSFPDPHICQYECDQNIHCQGFTYENARYADHSTVKCQFYESLAQGKESFCPTCIGFIKG